MSYLSLNLIALSHHSIFSHIRGHCLNHFLISEFQRISSPQGCAMICFRFEDLGYYNSGCQFHCEAGLRHYAMNRYFEHLTQVFTVNRLPFEP